MHQSDLLAFFVFMFAMSLAFSLGWQLRMWWAKRRVTPDERHIMRLACELVHLRTCLAGEPLTDQDAGRLKTQVVCNDLIVKTVIGSKVEYSPHWRN